MVATAGLPRIETYQVGEADLERRTNSLLYSFVELLISPELHQVLRQIDRADIGRHHIRG
jgi:hypothetical protein